jgi:hypothetical protein
MSFRIHPQPIAFSICAAEPIPTPKPTPTPIPAVATLSKPVHLIKITAPSNLAPSSPQPSPRQGPSSVAPTPAAPATNVPQLGSLVVLTNDTYLVAIHSPRRGAD